MRGWGAAVLGRGGLGGELLTKIEKNLEEVQGRGPINKREGVDKRGRSGTNWEKNSNKQGKESSFVVKKEANQRGSTR